MVNDLKKTKNFGLPVFPWDTILDITALAHSHPGGALDLTIGSPADSVAPGVQAALAQAADSHGYPAAVGTGQLREAIADYMQQVRGTVPLTADQVLLTVGSKELVASLPFQLGLGSDHIIGFPQVAYPTYEVGTLLAGAKPLRLPEDPSRWPTGEEAPALVWLNSPGNPDGHTYDVADLRAIVRWARENDAVVAADECYALLAWRGAPSGSAQGTPSLLDRRVCDADMRGLLAVHSLSKQSNLAGYRAAWICGDTALIARLREVRKHAGLMVPGPVQAAMLVALGDKDTVSRQIAVYHERREMLLRATRAAGLSNDADSVAGLYLWLSAEDVTDGRELARRLAQLGILVAPGDFYGEKGKKFVRMSLTANSQTIRQVCARLSE